LADIDQEVAVDTSRLKNIGMFSSLSDDELERLATLAREASADPGDVIVRAGTFPYQLFAIEEGTAEVRRDGEAIAELGAGEVVGETGVMKRGLRNAEVVATEPVRLIFFTQDQVRKLRRDMPELEQRLQSLLEERGG
jgi:CRP/FNR family transcriptional regulator, cyclic AMP receptor protein